MLTYQFRDRINRPNSSASGSMEYDNTVTHAISPACLLVYFAGACRVSCFNCRTVVYRAVVSVIMNSEKSHLSFSLQRPHMIIWASCIYTTKVFYMEMKTIFHSNFYNFRMHMKST